MRSNKSRKAKGVDGFTLIELLMVLGVIAVILAAGMGAFYQSFQLSSRTDLELSLDGANQVITNSLTSFVGFAQVSDLSGQTRSDCLAAGSTGVSGSQLTMTDDDKETIISLSGTDLASSSSNPVKVVNLNPEGVEVSAVSFVWKCRYGEPEKLTTSFTISTIQDGESVQAAKNYAFDMVLRNTGYY